VLVVVNRKAPVSPQVADYYRPRRAIPDRNVCYVDTTTDEEILWRVYEQEIEKPVGDCLKTAGLTEKILYIVLKRDAPFRHPLFPIYLVTRLAANDFADVKGMIDRSLNARNRGKFVIDLNSPGSNPANNWLRNAATLLPADRVILDETDKVLYDQRDVIGYASWGSNDPQRTRRWLGFLWLPGAIATEYVSSNARTLQRPPVDWNITTFQDTQHWFGGSPQDLSADLIHEGASGVSGNVYEPFLGGCARPEFVLPAYYEGRNLAESFYLGLPYLSWQGVVLGDPLMSLGRPGR
jgi:uncharacterized protein (TIGR03790 family)